MWPWIAINYVKGFVQVFIGQGWGIVKKRLRGAWLDSGQGEKSMSIPLSDFK